MPAARRSSIKVHSVTIRLTKSGADIGAVLHLAEIGDKTQIATVALAVRFELFYAVVAGTSFGMMLANIPAVIIGDRLAGKLPVKAIRIIAAILFAALGIVTLSGLRS